MPPFPQIPLFRRVTRPRRGRTSGLLAATAIVLGVAGTASAVRLEGTLADSDFPAPGPYRLEVLETGDTARITPGAPFSVTLPRDTIWTLCVRKGLPPEAFEKCFEVKAAPRDTLVTARIGDAGSGAAAGAAAGIVVAQPGTGLAEAAQAAETAPDETLAELPSAAAEDAVRLQKVVVRAQRTPKRAMGRETVSAKLIKRMPGLGEADVIRSIQGLPGVVASSDFSTKIYVRGGGSDQNLILFDNAPVFSPVHFFGLFSTFLVEGVEDVTFYKSGFPSEYGNRLSSVLDIHSREGGKDTANSWFTGSSLKLSTFASQAHTEGRQGPVRWLLAGRTTYIRQMIDFLRKQGLTTLDLDYYFYDMQGNLAYEFGEGRQLSVSLYQGRDRLNFNPLLLNWGNTAIPVNLEWKFNEAWNSRSTISYSLLSQSFGIVNIVEQYNKIATLQARQVLDYSGIENHRVSFGAAMENTGVVFRNDQYVVGSSERDEVSYYLTSVFAQDKWTPAFAPGWEFTPGVRLNHMSTLNQLGAEPRVTVKKQLPYDQSVDFHVGRYLQYINSIIFSDQENLNEFYYPAVKAKYRTVNPSSSVMIALGYSKNKLFDQYDFTAEAYYKKLDNLLIFASGSDVPEAVRNDPESRFGDFFKEAEGYSLGYELSLRRPAGALSGGINYSSGYSVIREENYAEPYYPKWHQPHSFKADLAVNWRGSDGIWSAPRGRYFRSSTQIKYATGLPYTEFAGYQRSHLLDQDQGTSSGGPTSGYLDNIELHYDNYNQSFVPGYFRWDVKPVDWGREGKWNFSWTILNITGHENVLLYSYDQTKNPPRRQTFTQFPFFPLLVSYEYYF